MEKLPSYDRWKTSEPDEREPSEMIEYNVTISIDVSKCTKWAGKPFRSDIACFTINALDEEQAEEIAETMLIEDIELHVEEAG